MSMDVRSRMEDMLTAAASASACAAAEAASLSARRLTCGWAVAGSHIRDVSFKISCRADEITDLEQEGNVASDTCSCRNPSTRFAS